MPISVTKNNMSTDTIKLIFTQAFPKEKLINAVELTEGFFNVAYKIVSDKCTRILKVAPTPSTPIMTHEKNIMYSETDSMKMIAEKTIIPVAKILFYDNTHKYCDSDYFFMEFLEGRSFSSCMGELDENVKSSILYEMGRITHQINQITGNRFGYYCQEDKQGNSWFEVFKSMISDTYADAARMNIDIPVTEAKTLELLNNDKDIFDEITTPRFVHWDIWAGNVFVKDGKVVGIVDFERCLWADPLMEAGFRTYDCSPSFLDGYGITLTENEKKRARWYDVYLFLISCLEADYRQYDNHFAYDWGTDMLKKYLVDKSE